MKVEYSSNNSGGDWWLRDQDWKNLEKAGWKVDWKKDGTDFLGRPYENGRWLGALATSATREGLTLREAIDEFESITGQWASTLGCTCCGPPHHFTEYNDDGNYVASNEHDYYDDDDDWDWSDEFEDDGPVT